MNPLFITRHDAMKKTHPFLQPKLLLICEKTTLNVPWLQILRTKVPCFWIIPNACNCLEMAWRVIPNAEASSSCVLHGSSSSNASNSASVKFLKLSMRFSRRFLRMKEENQHFPQMTIIWHKIRHFHTTKSIWRQNKITNVSKQFVYHMSKLGSWRFGQVKID